MAKVYVFLADGFEEIEALAPVDILRRGGQEVVTVSVMEKELVTGAHGVSVVADVQFGNAGSFEDADLLMLPGGMPGAAHLDQHERLGKVLVEQAARKGEIAAICAAPMVLGHLGLLRGKRATCYPGFESHLEGADYTADLVTVDGNITTGEGPAAAMAFGYQLLSLFVPAKQVEAIKEGMRYIHLMS